VVCDRNRPSVVIWGTRANESANDATLYRRTRALAKSLDDSRPVSGSMTGGSRRTWQTEWTEEVFAYDDYHAAPDGTVGIDDPPGNVPYLLAEAVGQFNYAARKGFDIKYRRAGDPAVLQQQALRHAQAHNKAANNPRICGVIAWCGFDYASLVNPYNNVKCPGVADGFRIPKPGAAFYLTQGDPKTRAVIAPDFFWDFGPQTPRGPGKQAAIFSNCERLELFIDGSHRATLEPDAKTYPHLKHPPFFTDLELDGAGHPELRIDGIVGGRMVLSRSFSSDPSQDQFVVRADDAELIGDGSDATRLEFKVADKFGAERAYGEGDVTFEVNGPGEIVGDNPFALTPAGGVGAVWIRTATGGSGPITVVARHSRLGTKSATINVRPAPAT
jgi:beta-galactosidase